jgi:hypothetical protein
VASPDTVLSLIKKYGTMMCLERLLIDKLPLVSRVIALSLFWLIIDSSTLYHCASIKYLIHNIWGEMLSTPTISDFVELLVLIFCFFDTPVVDPHPNAIVALV